MDKVGYVCPRCSHGLESPALNWDGDEGSCPDCLFTTDLLNWGLYSVYPAAQQLTRLMLMAGQATSF